jgi:ribosome biogenesis protein YTM1
MPSRKFHRGDKDDDDSASGSDSDDDDKLPAIPFDFLLNDKLLRLPLDSAARNMGLSTEHALELHYFPARLPPKKEGESEQLPDWIMVMDYNQQQQQSNKNLLFSGGADGVIRTFEQHAKEQGGELKSTCSISAHTGPIKCMSSLASSDNDLTYIATGSMDQTLVTHAYNSKTNELNLHAVYSGGHTNSISSVALAGCDDGKQIMASGDWDGGLAIWNVPGSNSTDDDNGGGDTAGSKSSSKKRKGNNSNSTSTSNEGGTIQEVQPIQSVRAHSSNISGLAWGYNNNSGSSSLPTTLLTGSWDHGLKVYDVSRMDCILALNGSRVVTSLSRCSNSDVVATGSPDCTVRLWDMRTNGDGSSGSQIADKTLRQSHKSWVSAIQWSPTDPFVLATTSHDGTLKVWDIRSSLPLHTVRATTNKGDKSLCLAFGDGFIYSGGSDCVVKKFAL